MKANPPPEKEELTEQEKVDAQRKEEEQKKQNRDKYLKIKEFEKRLLFDQEEKQRKRTEAQKPKDLENNEEKQKK